MYLLLKESREFLASYLRRRTIGKFIQVHRISNLDPDEAFCKKIVEQKFDCFLLSFAGHRLKPFLHFCVLLCDKINVPVLFEKYKEFCRSNLQLVFCLGDGQHKKESCRINPHPHIHSMAKSNSRFFLVWNLGFVWNPNTQCMDVWYISTYMKTISSIHVGKYTSPIECFVWKEVTLECLCRPFRGENGT